MFQIFFFMIISTVLLLPSWSFAVPTQSQLQMLQGMSDSEKQALIGRYGVSTEIKQTPETEIETIIPIIEVVPRAANEDAVLQPFGAFLFSGQPTTFAPVNNIPVPTDYILGPGDQLKLHLFGTKNESYELVIDRNGQITIPTLGPVTLSGMGFREAKVFLAKKVKTLGVGVNSSITMGEMRSFRIFVLGESRTPGSYLVSGMATITHALYVSGGLTDIASYRNVQLKRNGRLIKTLDLYDLLLKGDTSNDRRLQPGDTVFIPKLTKQVAVQGQVMKPALYEIKQERNLEQLIRLAGGLRSDAYSKAIQVSRITTPEAREKFSINLSQQEGARFIIKPGDRITVPEVTYSIDRLIKLSGEVSRTGSMAWKSGVKLLDLLPNRNHFTNEADLSFVLIKRQTKHSGLYEVLKASWLQAKSQPDSKENLLLLPRDEVILLSKNNPEQRRTQIDRLLDMIQLQATQRDPDKRVALRGPVQFSGQYPLVQGMRVADLIQMGGGVKPAAMLKEAEIIRYVVLDGQRREVDRLLVNLQKALSGDVLHNVLLKPYDSLMVKQVSDWSDASAVVTVSGEVSFPGSYVIKPGDTLESLLLRAGGFTQWAAPENTVFTRESLKIKERLEMDSMADELEKNLLFSLKTNADSSQDTASIAALGGDLIKKVKETPAIGRLVIGLNPEEKTRYQASLQLELRDGDALVVPKRSNEVVVMGEVSRPATLLYQAGLTVEDYLQQSGNVTKRADADAIYIVHGDGSIQQYKNSFFHTNNLRLNPGSVIIVPMDVERVSPMVTWTSVTKILSSLAITAATLQTLGVINR